MKNKKLQLLIATVISIAIGYLLTDLFFTTSIHQIKEFKELSFPKVLFGLFGAECRFVIGIALIPTLIYIFQEKSSKSKTTKS